MSRAPARLAVALAALGVCTAATPAPAPVRTVVLAKMAFGPAPPLHVGDVVEWRNDDMFQHTATARDGSFDLVLRPGARARVQLRKAGSVAVYCRYHPGMTLTLNVAK